MAPNVRLALYWDLFGSMVWRLKAGDRVRLKVFALIYSYTARSVPMTLTWTIREPGTSCLIGL